MLTPFSIAGGGTRQVYRNCRAFRVQLPSIGATFSIDGGHEFPLVAGEVFINKPIHGTDAPGQHRLYPDIAFIPGANALILGILDVEDGDHFNPLVLGTAPTGASAAQGDFLGFGIYNNLPSALTVPGPLGVPALGVWRFGIGGQSILAIPQLPGDNQIADGTAVTATPLNFISIGSDSINVPSTNFRQYAVRISGLTPPTTRVFTYAELRSDSSIAPLLSFTPGATITDVLVAIGAGTASTPTPIGATSEMHNLAMAPSPFVNIGMSAGVDTPRITIWARSGS